MILFYLVLSVFGAEQYFDQKLDHFNYNCNMTFKQRYFIDGSFFVSDGPGFIYVGGGAALKENHLMNDLLVDLAQEHRGVIYGLEHRYYGKSLPFPDLTVANLKYLSSDQAVEDLAYFTLNIGPYRPSKWVLIGGSYPGMLAAWGRQKYPNLFHAALASSTPVLAEKNFYKYDEMVGYALGKKCHSSVSNTMGYLDKLFSLGRLAPIKRTLNCTQVLDNKLFLFTIADIVADIVQYNNSTSPNIDDLCTAIEIPETKENTLLEFEKVLLTYFKTHLKTCYDYSYIQELKSLRPTEDDSIRQWTYQTCQEFGYWQTASTLPTRSKLLTVNWFESFYCSPPFFTPSIGPPNTDLIDFKNHGKDLNPSNILFTHGEKDPWLALSYTRHNSIIIPNGSHCNDLTPAIYILDSFAEIRNRIKSTFRTWLNSDSSGHV